AVGVEGDGVGVGALDEVDAVRVNNAGEVVVLLAVGPEQATVRVDGQGVVEVLRLVGGLVDRDEKDPDQGQPGGGRDDQGQAEPRPKTVAFFLVTHLPLGSGAGRPGYAGWAARARGSGRRSSRDSSDWKFSTWRRKAHFFSK